VEDVQDMSDGVDAEALALAGGISWALFVLVAGLGAMAIPQWEAAVNWLGQFYVGYTATPAGSVVGATWGFVDVFIGFYVFARLYNYFREHPPL
ncbi:MAG: bacteriophage holin, partial [Candidatus Nanohaloarchaea archaeon]|nr:bacteriophage holin [Candidatus Nanohaloarchaea archaeon]